MTDRLPVMRQMMCLFVLVGFYVLAAACLLGLAFGGGILLVLLSGDNAMGFVLGGLALGLLIGACVAALAPFKARPFVPTGVPLYRDDAPALWATLAELADVAGTRLPDQVWLTAVPNAAVVEHPRWLGLRPGRRYLLIGFPLLQALSVLQIRAVLAHEFGHYCHQDGHLTALGYRGHVAVGKMLERFPRRTLNPLSWIFRGYARLFILVQRAMSRRQELAADRVMAQAAGRVAAQSVLRMLPGLEAEWNRYLNVYVRAGFQADLAPCDVFGGFAKLLDARREQLTTAENAHVAPSRWDTHPPIADRLWALEAMSQNGRLLDADDNPGLRLLDDADQVASRLESAVFDFGGRRRLPWDSYPLEAMLAQLRDSAARAYRMISRVTERRQGSLEDVLALCATEDENALAAVGAVEKDLESAVLLAAYEAGSLRYVHAWDDFPELVRLDGTEADLPGFFDALFSATPEDADRARAILAELGVDPAAVAGDAQPSSPRRATTVGAIAHVKLDERLGYLFLTDLGLLFVPVIGKADDNGKSMLLRLLADSPAVLATREGAVWLPYEEFSRAERHRDVPIKATVTLHGGAVHKIHAVYTGYSHGKSHDTILEILRRHG
jgi:Zn-dependent protease with chaperone function